MHLSFAGSLECRRSPVLPGVTLIGRTAEGDALLASLFGAVPDDLPPRLEDAQLEQEDAAHYRLSSGARTWRLPARLFLHRDLSSAFYRALPPRPVPLAKRLFWQGVLAMARTRLGDWWLARSRD